MHELQSNINNGKISTAIKYKPQKQTQSHRTKTSWQMTCDRDSDNSLVNCQSSHYDKFNLCIH